MIFFRIEPGHDGRYPSVLAEPQRSSRHVLGFVELKSFTPPGMTRSLRDGIPTR